jgi:hypothetical protein
MSALHVKAIRRQMRPAPPLDFGGIAWGIFLRPD